MKSVLNCVIIFFALAFLTLSCFQHNKIEEDKSNRLSIKMVHRVDNKNIEFDSILYLNASGKYSVITLNYFVSNFSLQQENGTRLEMSGSFYIDATDRNTVTILQDMVIPPGMYSGLDFTFGLDTLTNITGRFLNPPKSKMEWPIPMGGGYHYMKLEGKFESDGLIKSYQAHSGELGGISYCVKVDLPLPPLEIGNDDVSVEIIMNINNWWQNPHAMDFNEVTAIMGDTVMQQKLMENGADVFSLGEIKQLQ